MAWTIEYRDGVLRNVRKLDPQVRRRIRDFLTSRIALMDDPRSIGDALQGARYRGLWRYRVGDWRVIVEIRDQVLVVLVLEIGHRREVYRD